MPPFLPPALDVEFYKEKYPDLQENYTSLQERGISLRDHYVGNGIKEGRMGSPACIRTDLIRAAMEEPSILEIGPFYRPAMVGEHVRYFDVFDSEQLRHIAAKYSADPKGIPHIDYVSPTADLGIVDRTFDAVFSSHAIEHQPDLVRHLQGVSRLLKDDGRYYIIIPDRRWTFDRFIHNSTLPEVLGAYAAGLKKHEARNIFINYIMKTHNNPAMHWAGSHGRPLYESNTDIIPKTFKELEDNPGYIDAHAWFFVPDNFHSIISELCQYGYIDLYPERVYHTVRGQIEFCAVLRKNKDAVHPQDSFVPHTQYAFLR